MKNNTHSSLGLSPLAFAELIKALVHAACPLAKQLCQLLSNTDAACESSCDTIYFILTNSLPLIGLQLIIGILRCGLPLMTLNTKVPC